MTTAIRPQQRYDHRLRELVSTPGEFRLATARGAPRSTARGWLGASSSAVVSPHGADRTEAELRQEIVTLQRRVTNLAALLRLALVVQPRGGRTLTGARVLDGPTRRDSYGPSRAAARLSRCEGSCGFCICRQAAFTPGAAGSTCVHSTISGHVPVRRRIA